MNKKTSKTIIGVIALVCVVIIGFLSYIYLDFSKNGLKFANYDSQRSEAMYLDFEDVTAEIKEGKIYSLSKEITYENITFSVSIDKVEETGTLLVCLEQSSSVYSPFKAEYFDLMEIKSTDGVSRTATNIFQSGTDKNGTALTLEPAGGSGDDDNPGKRVDTYYLRYEDGDYLKESDIEKSFPIDVTIKGYYETLTRNTL